MTGRALVVEVLAAEPAVNKPAVSAILLSYNCEAHLAGAVQSALEQDYAGPLQIVVSDDASCDGSFTVAEGRIAGYQGRHTVLLRRRSTNSGSKSAHLNDAIPFCTGDLLVSFDGDDVAAPSRVSRIVARFCANPDAQAVYSSYALIGSGSGSARPRRVPQPKAGTDPADWFARVDAYAAGATLAVRRSVIDEFGALDPMLNEDIQLPFRAALVGGVEFIDEPLVSVRRHAGSFTADWQRYASLERYRDRMLAGIENAARARLARLADIETIARKFPEQRDRWMRLRDLVERSWREAEMTRTLLGDRVGDRLRGLLALVRAGAYRDELAQHAFLALAPELYLRYRRQRLGLAGRADQPAAPGGA